MIAAYLTPLANHLSQSPFCGRGDCADLRVKKESRLRLKRDAQKGPVEIVVFECAEKPSAN